MNLLADLQPFLDTSLDIEVHSVVISAQQGALSVIVVMNLKIGAITNLNQTSQFN
jgi:hypothetical protein